MVYILFRITSVCMNLAYDRKTKTSHTGIKNKDILVIFNKLAEAINPAMLNHVNMCKCRLLASFIIRYQNKHKAEKQKPFR